MNTVSTTSVGFSKSCIGFCTFMCPNSPSFAPVHVHPLDVKEKKIWKNDSMTKNRARAMQEVCSRTTTNISLS